ncbi:hypothetical protein Tco_0007920 [Tanacetum coccineum]
MAAHTERMERFENVIFKQREELNDRIAEMFGLLKELTASRTLEKIPYHKHVKNIVEPNKSNVAETLEEVDRDDEAANRTNKERLGVPRKTSWEKK